MRLSLLRRNGLAVAVGISVMVAAPAISSAYKIAPWIVGGGIYSVIMCNDGVTKYGCFIGNLPTNCTYERDGGAAMLLCLHHGGFAKIGSDGETASQGLVGDYDGILRIPEYTGDQPINSTARTGLVAQCANRETYSCDDDSVPCPKVLPELEKQCSQSGGLASWAGYLNMTRKVDPRR